ncbi:MAG TPA: hypothetical protein PK440_18635 [Candidatus Accumulibacter phosphatis]|nr:hypothetical protein [Candidatus Accumulibacter phosphatis]HRQ96989.1 hypothetical protein [Candidatus Accumulibacter phosphatis]
MRTLLLVPRVGETAAVLVELPIMLGASWLICGRILRRSPLSPGEAVVTGACAFVLLMIAELSLSVLLAKRTLPAHLALYSETAHLLGLAGQIVFALFPVVRTMLAGHRLEPERSDPRAPPSGR